MSKEEAMGSPKIYEVWHFTETNLNFTDWVNFIYAEYDKVKINIFA